MDYVCVSAEDTKGKKLRGVRATGHCAEPEIKDGDIVILEDTPLEAGRTLLCQDTVSKVSCLLKYQKPADLAGFECFGVVHSITRQF